MPQQPGFDAGAIIEPFTHEAEQATNRLSFDDELCSYSAGGYVSCDGGDGLLTNPAAVAAIVDHGRRGCAPQALPASLRLAYERRFDVDLGGVRVHRSAAASAAAAALRARAFTFGSDIILGDDADPATLRHETTHAAQFARHPAPARPRGVASIAHPAHVQAREDVQRSLTSADGLVQRDELTRALSNPIDMGRVLYSRRDDIAREGFRALPLHHQAVVHALGLASGFTKSFWPAFLTNVTAEDQQELLREFTNPANIIEFHGGMIKGMLIGLIEGLKSQITGIYDLVTMAVKSPYAGVTRSVKNAVAQQADPIGYARKKKADADLASACSAALSHYLPALRTDPFALIGEGRKFGNAAGEDAAGWVRRDFMKRSSADKGELIGEVIGRIALEIVFLVLAPELLAVRASAHIAKAVRLGEFFRGAINKIPWLKRIVDAQKEQAAARQALEISLARAPSQITAGARTAGTIDARPHGFADLPQDVARHSDTHASKGRGQTQVERSSTTPATGTEQQPQTAGVRLATAQASPPSPHRGEPPRPQYRHQQLQQQQSKVPADVDAWHGLKRLEAPITEHRLTVTHDTLVPVMEGGTARIAVGKIVGDKLHRSVAAGMAHARREADKPRRDRISGARKAWEWVEEAGRAYWQSRVAPSEGFARGTVPHRGINVDTEYSAAGAAADAAAGTTRQGRGFLTVEPDSGWAERFNAAGELDLISLPEATMIADWTTAGWNFSFAAHKRGQFQKYLSAVRLRIETLTAKPVAKSNVQVHLHYISDRDPSAETIRCMKEVLGWFNLPNVTIYWHKL